MQHSRRIKCTLGLVAPIRVYAEADGQLADEKCSERDATCPLKGLIRRQLRRLSPVSSRLEFDLNIVRYLLMMSTNTAMLAPVCAKFYKVLRTACEILCVALANIDEQCFRILDTLNCCHLPDLIVRQRHQGDVAPYWGCGLAHLVRMLLVATHHYVGKCVGAFAQFDWLWHRQMSLDKLQVECNRARSNYDLNTAELPGYSLA